MNAISQPTQPRGADLLTLADVRAGDVGRSASSAPNGDNKRPVSRRSVNGIFVGRDQGDRHGGEPDDLLAHISAAAVAGDRNEVLALARQLAGKTDAQIGDDEDLLRLPKVADALDCTGRTVWRLVARKELPPPVHIGGSARWFRGDVREYLAGVRAVRGKRRL